MNQTVLVGRITKDLEVRYTTSDKAVCEFSLAVNRLGQEQADFINCTIWGKQAENLAKYQGKGSLIAITGQLRVDTYEVEGQRRYRTYVLANNIEYLGSKSSEEVNKEEPTTPVNEEDPYVQMGIKTEADELGFDLPF